MKSISDALDNYFETVPDFVRKKRWIIWLLTLAITVVSILGFSRLKFDQTTDGWFKDDDPVKVALDDFRAEFGGDDGVYIVYKPKDGNLFSSQSLEAVKGICNDIINARSKIKEGENSPLGHVVKVTSLVNANFLEVKDDMLTSRTLVGATIPTSLQQLDSIRRNAQSQKQFQLAYYSNDLKYGAISIETDFGAIPVDFKEPAANGSVESDGGLVIEEKTKETGKQASEKKVRFKPTDSNDYFALMTEINKVLNNHKYEDHLEFYPVGNSAQSIFDKKAMDQMGLLYLGMLVVMILILWFVFRSFSAVVWSILIIILATIWTIGFSGWLGITATFYVMLTVMMLLATGMADTIHILSEYLFYRNENYDHRTAQRLTFRKVALACVLTTVTTMIGFLALSVSPIVHIKVFGYMTTAGIILELVFTIYLLPLMLDIWPPVKKVARTRKLSASIAKYIPNISQIVQKRIEGVVPFVQKSPLGITFFFLVIFGLCIYGASLTKVSFNMMDNYEKTSLLRQSYELVDKHMMGTQNMEIFLNLGKEYAFQDPSVLTKIDELQKLIEKKYSKYVIRTSSMVDVVKDANQKLNGGKQEMYIIPANQEVVSQTLFMFNNASPTDRRRLVSDDYSKSNITVNLRNSDAASYQELFDQMQKDIDATVASLKQKYPDTKLILTGTLAMMMKASVQVAQSTGGSLAFAILAICITLLVVFGSFQAGLIAIVPNLIPSILTYSILGWFNMPLDMNTLLIGPIIIGVAVDDTIHFVTHYRAEVVIDGDVIRALNACIKESGQAVIFSTLVLGLGFGIMAFATGPAAITGKLGALAIFVGLICELCLLPAMILLFKPTFNWKKSVQTTNKVLIKQAI